MTSSSCPPARVLYIQCSGVTLVTLDAYISFLSFHQGGRHLHTDHRVKIGFEWSRGNGEGIPDDVSALEKSLK